MQFNGKVQEALRHIHSQFPGVTQVFFGSDGKWLFCDVNFEAPNFDHASGYVDVLLLEDALDAADKDKGLPCAYRLLTLDDLYSWWDMLRDIPVSEGTAVVEAGAIEEPFMHFAVGTQREDIWHWFEAQHPDFVVGEVIQGIRRKNSDDT